MGTLLLIRHGQASYGEADYDRLSTRGHEQARAVGTWIAGAKIDALFSGPLRRQVQTATALREQAAAHGAKLPALRELAGLAEYPAFEMLKYLMPRLVAEDPKFANLESAPTPRRLDDAFRTVLAKWGNDDWQHEGVERVTDFVARVRAALIEALASVPAKSRIACVTSAGPIGVAVGLAFGVTAQQMVRTSIVIRNASVTELRFRSERVARERDLTPDHVSLVTFNVTGHLPAELTTER